MQFIKEFTTKCKTYKLIHFSEVQLNNNIYFKAHLINTLK